MNIHNFMTSCSIATSLAALCLSAVSLYRSEDNTRFVDNLSHLDKGSQIDGLSGMISSDSFVFRQAVVSVIDEYVQNKREQSLATELEMYSSAPAKSDEHIYGSPNAEVLLYLFSDISCPYCARLFPQLRDLTTNSDGKIALVYRHFPLGIHGEKAIRSSLYLECVALYGGNKKFWLATDQLFRNVPTNDLTDLLLLSSNEIDKCMNSREIAAQVMESVNEGNRLGINSTPTVVIYDRKTDQRLTISAPRSADEIKLQIATMKISNDRGRTLSEIGRGN